jgi:hypothetical protein
MNTNRHEDKAQFLIDCALRIFEDNLLFAFIGGSVAAGIHKRQSDIDVFVTTKSPNYSQEVQFARLMRRVHMEMKLSFDHYGEILDIDTLDSLLTLTEVTLQKNSWMISSPCYLGNCILSYFRKGLVLQYLIAGPKILCYDPEGIVTDYTNRAIDILKSLSLTFPSSASHIKNLTTNQKAIVGLIEESWARRDGLDTPVGLSLWTWFDPHIRPVEQTVLPEATLDPERMMACPLANNGKVSAPGMEVIRHQCVGEYVQITELCKDHTKRRFA